MKFTENHEWVELLGSDRARVGITDYAAEQLGDVVFVQLPEVGQKVSAGDAVAEVESTKSVSDIYSPLAGEVVAHNEQLDDQPELVNSGPFEDGWMFELQVEDASVVESLMDSDGYQEFISQE